MAPGLRRLVRALARAGYREMAFDEMMKLAEKAARDYIFSEIYHPETGLPYGGFRKTRQGE